MIKNINVFPGNLGSDVEVRVSKSGKEFASGSIAVYQGKDDKGKPESFWLDFSTSWGVDEIRDAKKGERLIVTGSLKRVDWVSKSGKPGVSLKIDFADVERFKQSPKTFKPQQKSPNQVDEFQIDDVPEIDLDGVNLHMPF